MLAALSEFDALERQIHSFYSGGTHYIKDDDERDEATDPIWEAQRPVLDQVCSRPAHTLEGLQARARTIVLENPELDPAVDAIEACSTNDRLVAALLRDLLALGGTA